MAVKPWKGACVAPSDWSAPADGAEEPDASLELAWVHGYRCRGVRQNVGYTSSGKGNSSKDQNNNNNNNNKTCSDQHTTTHQPRVCASQATLCTRLLLSASWPT